jgi:hypothetical protein
VRFFSHPVVRRTMKARDRRSFFIRLLCLCYFVSIVPQAVK